MDKIAKFQKVSFDQFKKDFGSEDSENFVKFIYDNIKLPVRSTSGSAGYDFFSPFHFVLNPGERIKLPTGIRCKMNKGWFLAIFIRSSIGFKYETILTNGTGIIDSDYFNADNEGHIFIKLRNDWNKPLHVGSGDAVCQGIFLQYGITEDDNATAKRVGGIGSTNNVAG